MSSPSIMLKAGPHALARIREEGLSPDLFRVMVGASGGPKWFILSGLDRYLAGEFFKDRQQPLDLLGSSVGGWRMTAYACHNPLAALTYFRDRYHHLTYPAKVTTAQVSQSSRELIQSFLSEDQIHTVCRNPVFKLHLVTSACRGIVATDQPALQLSGLLLAAGANAINRRLLSRFFHRALFHVAHSEAPFLQLQDYPTENVTLNTNNLAKVLEATGAIPLVLEGVRDIEGSRHAVHRDGGIVDYHFDLPFAPRDKGLVLYPHFYDRAIPGWFDKGLKWRRPDPRHYDNVVMVAPSRSLVAGLPYGRISDRKDFSNLDDASRIRYWQHIIDASERMAEEFAQRVEQQRWDDVLQPFV